LSPGPDPGPVEYVVLVDESGRPVGQAEKWAAHNLETPLHLAFSCYVFDDSGRLLVTRRALTKKVWPGVWSNSVCGHPQPGESIQDAIARRLQYELGMTAERLEVLLPDYRYLAPAFEGVVENEFCPVYLARATSEPKPNPEEVEDFEWVPWNDFVVLAREDAGNTYSWWCKDQLGSLITDPHATEIIRNHIGTGRQVNEQAGHFEAMYQTTPPWDIGRPQPEFLALAESGRLTGRVLDVGCGTGEHALMAAAIGLEVVGIDAAPTAIAAAERKAAERGLQARFVLGDALELEKLGSTFETVLDCGLFHVFDDADRARFVRSLAAVVEPGGLYFMLCFSEHQPGELGPRRVTQAEIRAGFSAGWRVESIAASEIQLFGGGAAQAWLAEIVRTA
jgi:isopentenyl-diphosphate delta-isomerase type 1